MTSLAMIVHLLHVLMASLMGSLRTVEYSHWERWAGHVDYEGSKD